ncbi:MAG: hypothetical protein J5793_02035 [Clostridia bacterium]|nr:hypothetical protein [Clostridia bacterium]
MFKKYAALFVLIALVFSLASCANGGDGDTSDDPAQYSGGNGQASDPESVIPELDRDTALALVAADREITDLFMNNRLASPGYTHSTKVTIGTGYYYYAPIEELFASTYLPTGPAKEFFESYPGYGEPAVSNKDGYTYSFYHPGSGFDGFLDETVIVVRPGEQPDRRIIRSATLSGVRVTLDCVYHEGKWLLEKGLYLSLPEESDFCDAEYPGSRLGSLSEFSGNILAVELYVSDDESGFDKEKEELYSSKIDTALDYLVSEASRYGEAPVIDRAKAYFDHKGALGTGMYDLDIMFASTSLGTLDGLVKKQFDTEGYDGYLVFVCLDKEVPTYFDRYEGTSSTEIYYAERVIIGSGSEVSDIALGVLGLLGASDFGTDYCEEDISKIFGVYFPDEIMLTKDITNGHVSPVNAFICGMTDGLEKLLRAFRAKS